MTARAQHEAHIRFSPGQQLSFGDTLQPARTPKTLALRSYHVTSPACTVAEALDGEKRAKTQEAVILRLFQSNNGAHLSPSEVCHTVNVGRERPWPIVSIRRAITNLTDRGELVHHKHDRRPGPYTALESTWSLA